MGNSDPPPRLADRDLRRMDSAEPDSDQPPRPEDPVPMSVDSVDPASIPTPSDESWTELYDRTCGDTTPAAGGRGRKKRPRSPECVPDKRRKQDALRMAFVHSKDTLKANCTHWGPRWMTLQPLKGWRLPLRRGQQSYVIAPWDRSSPRMMNRDLPKKWTLRRAASSTPGVSSRFSPLILRRL